MINISRLDELLDWINKDFLNKSRPFLLCIKTEGKKGTKIVAKTSIDPIMSQVRVAFKNWAFISYVLNDTLTIIVHCVRI